MKKQKVGLDFETYGSVNLPKHGLDRYTQDIFFQPLIASVVERGPDGALRKYRFNFAARPKDLADMMHDVIKDKTIVAHNAGFERAVLSWGGFPLPASRFIDSAVVASAVGAGRSLAAAAPQLLDINKMEEGWDLIKLFSMPGRFQEANSHDGFDYDIVKAYPSEWAKFHDYCDLDAELGLRIVESYGDWITEEEHEFNGVTMDMNSKGWRVDVPTVEEMIRRRDDNQAQALEDFHAMHDVPGEEPLNLNSLPQQIKWCADRGIKARSFDEKNVERVLGRLEAKLEEGVADKVKRENYEAVVHMLRTKQIVGGSSLKKLDVIVNTTSDDQILRDQYLHCGAGQTLRTTGRSVQMQNLKRIGDEPDDMSELEPGNKGLRVHWDNDKLAKNIRQVFVSDHPQGELIVGDFTGVENRNLAWLAQEDWKVAAFRANKDMYKELARKIFGIPLSVEVLKSQRQVGKVGELSCGYGAGEGAIVSFAEGMGVPMTEGEALKLKRDWRDANPKIVEFWEILNDMLHEVMRGGTGVVSNHMLPDNFMLQLRLIDAPASLQKQDTRAKHSLQVSIWDRESNQPFMFRYFHGIYERGSNLGYFKPSSLKGGDLWKATYTDPKTKQIRHYEIYGGKLAGIVTQSFCRELFFRVLVKVKAWVDRYDNLHLIGQFHDEIVLDWQPAGPGDIGLDEAKADLEDLMSDAGRARTFPLAADIKSDYRYTK